MKLNLKGGEDARTLSKRASLLDTAGRLLIVALFLIIGIRNLQKFHVDDHIARLTKFKAPFPRVTFWVVRPWSSSPAP